MASASTVSFDSLVRLLPNEREAREKQLSIFAELGLAVHSSRPSFDNFFKLEFL